MVVMMMMVWNLLSVGDCPDSEEKTLTKNLHLMLTNNLDVVDLEFSSFGLMMLLMPGGERRYYQNLGNIYIYTRTRESLMLELQTSCHRLIGDFPILYMMVEVVGQLCNAD